MVSVKFDSTYRYHLCSKSALIESARESKRVATREFALLLLPLYFIKFINFASLTTPSYAILVRVRTHACLRVLAGRLTCLRRRDGGSSLNAAASLTVFRHTAPT
ncbi:hypothetical protein P5V15_005701 [Pogonomyrmex californicus]